MKMSSILFILGVFLLSGCNDGFYKLEYAKKTTTPPTVSPPPTAVAIGDGSLCSIFSDTSLQCWGASSFGQAGIMSNWSPSLAAASDVTTTLPSISLTPHTPSTRGFISKFKTSTNHSCFIVDSRLICFGNLSGYISGDGSSGLFIRELFTSGIVDFDFADTHGCAINNVGELHCWGSNGAGELGNGTTTDSLTATKIFPGNVSALSLHFERSCAIVGGALYCWGKSQLTPVLIEPANVSKVSTGAAHVCAIVGGALKCWGANSRGELGSANSSLSYYEPFSSGVTDVSVSGSTSCAVVNGAAYCWGLNDYAQVAQNPSTAAVTAPFQILPSPVSKIEVGNYSVCASGPGGLSCWGRNDTSQLGLGPASPYEITPQQVLPYNVDDISISLNGSCALNGNDIYCWGKNGSRMLDPYSALNAIIPLPKKVLNREYFGTSYAYGVQRPFEALTLGSGHGCYIANSGALSCVGANGFGQLGINSVVNKLTFTQVFSSGVSSAVAGLTHTCAIVSGALYCWGQNNNAQIGKGSFATGDTVLSPYQVYPSGVTAVDVSDTATCALLAGELYCWGLFPGLNASFSKKMLSYPIETFALGKNHLCAINSGALECFGENLAGQVNPTFSSNAPLTQVFASGVTGVALGDTHSCAIVSGALYCWGSNSNGQIGNGTTASPVLTPYQVFASGVTKVKARGNSTCAVVNNDLKCWGSNSFGQVTNREKEIISTPFTVKVGGVDHFDVGSNFACYSLNSKLYCWGENTSGQLALGYQGNIHRKPKTIIAEKVTKVATGYRNTCAVVDGDLKCWGKNGTGVITNGLTVDNTLIPYSVLSGGVTEAAISSNHGCAIQNDSLKCWGTQSSGKVGNGATTSAILSTPYTVFPNSVTQLAVGDLHSCALVAGALHCWGSNSTYQIADSTVAGPVLTPLQIFASGVQKVVTGRAHTCAIVNDYLHCWGANNYGQIGNGTTIDVENPYQVLAKKIKDVASLANSVCAIDIDDEMFCWGRNLNGIIDSATPLSSVLSPKLLSPVGSIARLWSSTSYPGNGVSAGLDYTNYCLVDNALVCMGDNKLGQIRIPLSSTPTTSLTTIDLTQY